MEETKKKAVVSTTPTTVKKRPFKGIISDDAKNIPSIALEEWIKPSIQEFLNKTLKNIIDVLFYGKGAEQKQTRFNNLGTSRISYTPYASIYNKKEDTAPARSHPVYDYDTIKYNTIYDAQAVKNCLLDSLERYPSVNVADLYEFSGLTPSATDYNYGWKTLTAESIKVIPSGDGRYYLDLPKVMPLK